MGKGRMNGRDKWKTQDAVLNRSLSSEKRKKKTRSEVLIKKNSENLIYLVGQVALNKESVGVRARTDKRIRTCAEPWGIMGIARGVRLYWNNEG